MTNSQKNNIKQWIKALRSGNYKQGNGYLKHGKDNDIYHCCLGVAIEIQGIKFVPVENQANYYITTFDEANSMTSPSCSWFEKIYGFYHTINMFNDYDSPPNNLMILNDSRKYTFDQIADIIENKFIKN